MSDAGSPPSYQRVAALKTVAQLSAHLSALGIAEQLPVTTGTNGAGDGRSPAPLAEPLQLRSGQVIGNRFCVQPMEGWDGQRDGLPSDLVRRRWRSFGRSGAKLIWGGEAAAVEHAGRANPHQLVVADHSAAALAALRGELVAAHQAEHGSTDDLLVGLQLTHSGRFSRPASKDRLAPQILYHHPVLDGRFGIGADHPVMTDAQIEALVERFVAAGVIAHQAGFDFVDVKHCHGYLGHEFLSAVDRPGPFGGSFENRTRFLRTVVAGLRARAPELLIGVRISAFDFVPFEAAGEHGVGQPSATPLPYRNGFGTNPDAPTGMDLTAAVQFLQLLRELHVELVNITAGSPYYNPHIQRPALFPPSDGYLPPEDPLVGVARQIEAVRTLRAQVPELTYVGSGYSYLQEWLPPVAAAVVARGGTDLVGLGRMMLSYPTLPADVLAGKPLQRKRICRTFSDCTTAPRNGMISGCFPLDPFYRDRPEAAELKQLKAGS